MVASDSPTCFISPVVEDRYLVYAPLHQFSAILDARELRQFESAKSGGGGKFDHVVSELVQR